VNDIDKWKIKFYISESLIENTIYSLKKLISFKNQPEMDNLEKIFSDFECEKAFEKFIYHCKNLETHMND
jgi:hypothetical protein